MTHREQLCEYQFEINNALEQCFVVRNVPQAEIYKAMRYSLNAGGKRIRPVLTLEFARLCGVSAKTAMPFACALEMIHTYSLIHDDLPCMDDDAMRRGRATNHIVFGEAIAVLAGDALLNGAFEHILCKSHDLPSETVLRAAACLAKASGAEGMIGGQVIDMAGERRALELHEIKTLQRLKTGALIRAGAELGCILGKADSEKLEAARKYADMLGLAFQMKDDILNVEGDPEVIGKDVGNDEESGKSTFVNLLGIENCKKRLAELTEDAVCAVLGFEGSEFLQWLAYSLADREK